MSTEALTETVDESVVEDVAEAQPDPEIVERAIKYGWKSPDDWKGDPPEQGFVSPEDYLEKPHVQVKILREQNEALSKSVQEIEARSKDTYDRMDKMYREAAERRKEAHEAEKARIREEMRVAASEADTERYETLEKEYDNLPPPETADDGFDLAGWKAANPWLDTDPLAKAYALAVANQVAGVGGGAEQQATAAEREVRKRFPELFEKAEAPPPPKPSRVDGGGLAALSGKSMGDRLPPEALAQAKVDVADGLYGSVNDWAKVYFEDETNG